MLNPVYPTKRVLALALAAALLAGCSSTATSPTASTTAKSSGTASTAAGSASPTASATTSAAFAALESRYHANLGLYAIDTGTGSTVAYNADKRFAFCSTFKTFATGILLQRDTNQQLSQVVKYTKADILSYAPITSQHLATGMTVSALMAAALDYSDNTAANLLLRQIGGPSAFQAALRAEGDATSNVDRNEPTLNSNTPGDTRDTTTPRTAAADLRTFALGSALTATRRAQLVAWLQANTTGGPYIRAAVPSGWKVGDKTGSGDYGARNDIAVIWPPDNAAPIVIAIYTNRGDNANATSNDALISDATKVALRPLTGQA
ncbi:class A beta-lactamase [Actinospica sp. MGRD01-02]|uniref:Class A beta-lactamase n=1 Tax=Actinospica acidithermotolerans TaxID=2828514 RepID=A0A941EAD0_9ACTN|nr:class A beta-lactamase [Actinospica acidithermotolerans]MBR7826777.1 class A beta-lactamase [Actinospica acidithermotolerans]